MDPRRPQFPSQPASAFQSTANIPHPHRETASAPIPSPTTQQSHYFEPFRPQSQMPQPSSQQQQQQQQQPPEQMQPIRVSSYKYDPDRTGAGATAQETSTFISNYALVAEAAKRAQMHVLMRDMEGVDLHQTS